MSHWPRFKEEKIKNAMDKMYNLVEHLHELAATTRLTEERQARYVEYKSSNTISMEDPDVFPCVNLPHRRNAKFYGREQQIQDMDEYLNPQAARNLRTFTIYGRRGVGKTNIALEYAYRNPSRFDAVFWIGCETSASLRTSFLGMALALKLGGVSSTTHHEEILILCQRWMLRTDKFWLLIFDNAEDEELLKDIWPTSKGAIIITSRRFVNFSNQALRKGQTVQPFEFQDGWELFVRSVGWESKLMNHEIPPDEVRAGEELVQEFDGLPLSIDQAASLLKTERFASTIELLHAFRPAKAIVDPRPTHIHSKTNHAIDALWHVIFQNLGKNARNLLSILCLLSPDITYIDVFQPKDQTVLMPFTEFLRRETGSTAQSSAGLREAMTELINGSLIKREGRILTIHRVVQEAFFYVNKAEHAASFYAAVRLIYEAFPKQVKGRPLHGQWERCERFIHEAISLCGKYRDFQRNGEEIPYPPEFCPLLTSCAWFLFEVGDYGEIFKMLEVALDVCDDKTSLSYAHLKNTAGASFFELNKLQDCREAYETTFKIRSQHLPADDEELADAMHNLGNLEHAEGNYEKALELFGKARDNRMSVGDEAQVPLSLTLMGIGRTYESMKRYDDAAGEYEEAEGLILRTTGQGSPFMARYVSPPSHSSCPVSFPNSATHRFLRPPQSPLRPRQPRAHPEGPGRRAQQLRQGAQGAQHHHAHAPAGVVHALQGRLRRVRLGQLAECQAPPRRGARDRRAAPPRRRRRPPRPHPVEARRDPGRRPLGVLAARQPGRGRGRAGAGRADADQAGEERQCGVRRGWGVG